MEKHYAFSREGFSVVCTKTQDDRYILGKIYHGIPDSQRSGYYGIRDERDYVGTTGRTFQQWYDSCVWVDYDFEEVEEVEQC